MRSCSACQYRNRSEKKYIYFVPSHTLRKVEQETLYEMFFICDSYFDESCLERDLEIIIIVLLCLFKISAFLKN